MEASGDNEKSQQSKMVKPKMDCCYWNAKGRMENKPRATIHCDYCQCVFDRRKQFDNHNWIHECSQCHELGDVRAHKVRHQQETQLEALQEQRQRQMDDDFVLCYVRANRLHQYRPQLHYEPDFNFIMLNCRFEKDEWLAFVKKFKRQILDLFYGGFKAVLDFEERHQHDRLIWQFNAQFISNLLENGTLFVCDAIDFLNILMTKVGYDDYVSVLISYLLKKDFKIKAEWVAKVINDDKLMERIKENHTFTFDVIHKARQWDCLSPFDVNGLKTFYTQLQKHFFNLEFQNPFDELCYEDLQTNPIHIRQRHRFCYDTKDDELSVVVGSGKYEKSHSLGSCAKMMERSLADLIKEYIKEMKVYHELDERSENPIDGRRRQLFRYFPGLDSYENSNCFCYDIDSNAQLQINEQRCVVSKLYFAISMK